MKPNNGEEAVSPVIGVILMVAITVTLAAVVYVMMSDLGQPVEQTPYLVFQADGDDYVLLSAPPDLEWSDFTVTGCTTIPTGPVLAGGTLEDCTDPVRVIHNRTNTLSWTS